MVDKSFTDTTAEKKTSVNTNNNRFQVTTEPLSNKGIEIFFRVRSREPGSLSREPGSDVISSETRTVAVSPDVETMEAMEGIKEVVEEPVAYFETVQDMSTSGQRHTGLK